MIDEQQAMETLARKLPVMPPIHLVVEPAAAMGIVGTLQLALRHPENNGPTAKMIDGFCRDLIDRFPPDVRPILMAGFDRANDVPVSSEQTNR